MPGPGRRCVSSFLKRELWVCYFFISWGSIWYTSPDNQDGITLNGITAFWHINLIPPVWHHLRTWWQQTVSSPKSFIKTLNRTRKKSSVHIHSTYVYLKYTWKCALKSHEKSIVTGKREKITAVFKKGRKENPWNCRLVRFTYVPVNIMEQILTEAMLRRCQQLRLFH